MKKVLKMRRDRMATITKPKAKAIGHGGDLADAIASANRAAVATYNEHVKKFGTFSKGTRAF